MRAGHKRLRRRMLGVAIGVAAAFGLLLAGGLGASVARADDGPQLHHDASVDLATLSAGVAFNPVITGRPRLISQDIEKDAKGSSTPTRAKSKAPKPPGSTVTSTNPGFSGFNGLTDFDQVAAGTGPYAGTQGDLEPPDQGLCVGNGFVLETINLALRVDDTSGSPQTLPVPINQFLDVAPEFDGASFGPFLSDPKCYYDASTGRWFFTVLELGLDPSTAAFDGTAAQYVAVSTSDDPTLGWNIYSFDTTNDFGPDCPCAGDQPLIGADQYGFFVSTNSFPLFADGFNGAVIYAISKSQLVAGAPSPTIVQLDEPKLAEGQAYSVQPATTPSGIYDTTFGGTEYFMSALDFNNTADTRIAVWSVNNTSSLDSVPALTVDNQLVGAEKYVFPPVASQKDGDTPLRDCLNDSECSTAVFGGTDAFAPNPVNPLNMNDDRMNQVVFANGTLWGGVNTAVKQPDGVTRSGIAWFAISPHMKKLGKLRAALVGHGYLSVNGNNVFFPSIGVNDAGDAVMGYTLSGPDYFPSAAYTILKSHTQAVANPPVVHVAGAGLGPADGFSGYQALDDVDQGVERWGDYSAAVAAMDGSVWFATEYIGQTCTLSDWLGDSTCGGTRTFYANFGTFVGNVTP